MLTRLARFSIRRRRLVIGGWLAVLVIGFVFGGAVFGRLESQGLQVPEDAESVTAARASVTRPIDATPRGPRLVGLYDGIGADDPQVGRVVGQLRSMPGVLEVSDPIPARDGRAALIAVQLGLPPNERPIVAALRSVRAPTVLVTGDDIVDEEFGDQAEKDLQKAEMLAFPVLLVLLVVLFGGVVAACLPLLVALVALAGTLLILLFLSSLTDVSSFSVNVASMLGLGLAVDYGLLLVSRFREERVGSDSYVAIERTMATAGRTIVFSGLTVAVALSGLLVYSDGFLRSMAAGGIGVVLLGLAAALTLLPALLAAWHRRIKPARRAASDTSGLFARLSRVVMRRAVPITVVVAAGLALLGTPFLRAHFEEPDARYLPTSSESRRVADIVESRFSEGLGTDPIGVVASVDRRSPALASYVERLRAMPGVVSVQVAGATAAANRTLIQVVPEGTTQGATAKGLVHAIRDLRDEGVPFATAVTGDAAELVDTEQAVLDRLPWCLALLVGATFVLLFLLTGSLVVPLKALAMNFLSLGATLGALVWVFQDGNLTGVLGVDAAGSLDIATPLLIFVIAFGLSMDYEVFLLARIREAYLNSGDNDAAVAAGLQRTGRIVTSAAALIVIVFLGFLAGGFLSIKQAGLGLALAVLLDATVVRMLLVPATMKLLGHWNWWAPAPLRRLHPMVRSGHAGRRWGAEEDGDGGLAEAPGMTASVP